jgi:fumarylacetoacetate (FAA) hydrolase family protein
MVKGAPDVIIPGDPTLCIEIKRRDHTQSHWDKGQMEYLLAARDNGAIVGVALGCDAAMELINDWRAVFI